MAVAQLNAALEALYPVVSVGGNTPLTDLAPVRLHGEVMGIYNSMVDIGVVPGVSFVRANAVAAGYHAAILATGAPSHPRPS